jgi:phosphoribosyl 1,2-cyclic phosphodiesterase
MRPAGRGLHAAAWGRVLLCSSSVFLLVGLAFRSCTQSSSLRPTRHPTHFSLAESLAAARRVGARRTLLVHMAHDIEHAAVSATLPMGVELAYDGLAVPLVEVITAT